METSGPRTTCLALERLSKVQASSLRLTWPSDSPSVPTSRFHTAIHGVRLCLRLGVHALAIPLPSSLANAKSPGDSSRERILLRHCGGIVPPPRSSNRLDSSAPYRDSRITHWNVHSGSAGLETFLLRSRLLSGGVRCHSATCHRTRNQLSDFDLVYRSVCAAKSAQYQ
jgi:hypothetical protein